MQGIEMWFSGETGVTDKRIPCTSSITIVVGGLLFSVHAALKANNLPTCSQLRSMKGSKLTKSDSYLILEKLIQKGLLVIKPDGLVTWLGNLENTGQITEQESKDLLALAEQLNIYDLRFTEHSFMLLSTNLYLHPSMLKTDPSGST